MRPTLLWLLVSPAALMGIADAAASPRDGTNAKAMEEEFSRTIKALKSISTP